MPDSVPELLDKILKIQDPLQKEIREKARKAELRNGVPKTTVHARLISMEV